MRNNINDKKIEFLMDAKIECETCGDTGEVTTMEQVYPNEPHTAPIGTGRCPDCNLKEEEEYDNQE